MQKHILIFILVVPFTLTMAQKNKYKYSYDFSITTSSACSSSFLQDSSINYTQQTLLEIELKDCINNAIPFATLSLKKLTVHLFSAHLMKKAKYLYT